MRTIDFPTITGWLAVSIRWMFLMVLTISLSFWGKILALPNILLIGLVCWNIALPC
jgi:hypothetical protein